MKVGKLHVNKNAVVCENVACYDNSPDLYFQEHPLWLERVSPSLDRRKRSNFPWLNFRFCSSHKSTKATTVLQSNVALSNRQRSLKYYPSIQILSLIGRDVQRLFCSFLWMRKIWRDELLRFSMLPTHHHI